MTKIEFLEALERVYISIEQQIPNYMANEEDRSISDGNVAVCIIDEEGQIYGKMFGEDKVRRRSFYRIAWVKASQVWITKMKTGQFEEEVFAKRVDDKPFGIERPDFIGWEGGQPLQLGNRPLAVGFSGFRGVNDLEIMVNAVEYAMKG